MSTLARLSCVAALLAALGFGACGPNSGASASSPTPQVAGLVNVTPTGNSTSQYSQVGPLTIKKISGDGVANVGSRWTLHVQVLDGNGDSVQGALVRFEAADPSKPFVGLGLAVTDAAGQASSQATPTVPGAAVVNVNASTAYLSASPITFTVTGQ